MPRIAILDVGYREVSARAAAVCAEAWGVAEPSAVCTVDTGGIGEYRPGAFFERELPPLLAVLRALAQPPELLVIDGYVWLDAAGRKGLGAHLHDAVGLPVVGVAKTAFDGSAHAVPVLRGQSQRPLYVTAVGADPAAAAHAVREMHGPYRIPTLLALADRLSREATPPG
jgi:deoxyribonuclease V